MQNVPEPTGQVLVEKLTLERGSKIRQGPNSGLQIMCLSHAARATGNRKVQYTNCGIYFGKKFQKYVKLPIILKIDKLFQPNIAEVDTSEAETTLLLLLGREAGYETRFR